MGLDVSYYNLSSITTADDPVSALGDGRISTVLLLRSSSVQLDNLASTNHIVCVGRQRFGVLTLTVHSPGLSLSCLYIGIC